MNNIRILSLLLLFAIVLALLTGCNNNKSITSVEAQTTDSTTVESTKETYPPAEEFNPAEIVAYEPDNEVKRNKYLEEVCNKRFVFYLEVNEIGSEHGISGQLYPNDAFYIDEENADLVLPTLYATSYISRMNKDQVNNCLCYQAKYTSVTFDDEIWETLEKGDRITFEGSINSSYTEFRATRFSVCIEKAVLISKN